MGSRRLSLLFRTLSVWRRQSAGAFADADLDVGVKRGPGFEVVSYKCRVRVGFSFTSQERELTTSLSGVSGSKGPLGLVGCVGPVAFGFTVYLLARPRVPSFLFRWRAAGDGRRSRRASGPETRAAVFDAHPWAGAPPSRGGFSGPGRRGRGTPARHARLLFRPPAPAAARNVRRVPTTPATVPRLSETRRQGLGLWRSSRASLRRVPVSREPRGESPRRAAGGVARPRAERKHDRRRIEGRCGSRELRRGAAVGGGPMRCRGRAGRLTQLSRRRRPCALRYRGRARALPRPPGRGGPPNTGSRRAGARRGVAGRGAASERSAAGRTQRWESGEGRRWKEGGPTARRRGRRHGARRLSLLRPEEWRSARPREGRSAKPP